MPGRRPTLVRALLVLLSPASPARPGLALPWHLVAVVASGQARLDQQMPSTATATRQGAAAHMQVECRNKRSVGAGRAQVELV